MDREVKRLKQSHITIMKVRWNSRRGPEFTWEREDQMKEKCLAVDVFACFMVMAALVISISSDVSVESVGSYFPRVILIGSISVEVPVAPEVGAAAVASPAGVLDVRNKKSLGHCQY
ncbi:hypothetical protein Tco_0196760 [Tanacetum coccineum]